MLLLLMMLHNSPVPRATSHRMTSCSEQKVQRLHHSNRKWTGWDACRHGLLRGRHHEAPQKKLAASCFNFTLLHFIFTPFPSSSAPTENGKPAVPCLALPRLAVPCLALPRAPSLSQATPKPYPSSKPSAAIAIATTVASKLPLAFLPLPSVVPASLAAPLLLASHPSPPHPMHVCLIHPRSRNRLFIRPS